MSTVYFTTIKNAIVAEVEAEVMPPIEADRIAAEAAASNAAGSATAAGAYLSAVEAAVDGIPTEAQLPLQAVSRTILAGFTGMTAGRQAMLSENRLAGLFVFSPVNMSAQVSADPYKGLYVPPSSDPTGASGAWVRQVSDNTYHFEWWLPSAMPAAAQTRFNSMMDNLPAGARLVLAPRDMTVTGSCIVDVELSEIVGSGRKGRLIGDGSLFQVVKILANGVTLRRVVAGGVNGETSGLGEACAFHVYDGFEPFGTSPYRSVSWVRFVECGAFDCDTGFRIGYNVNETESSVYPSHDVWLTDCWTDGVHHMQGEFFCARRVTVTGGKYIAGTPQATSNGLQKHFRVIGAADTIFSGCHFVGYDEALPGSVGILFEIAGFDSDTFLAPRDTIITGCNFENFSTDIFVYWHEGACLISGNVASGRKNEQTQFLFVSARGIINTRKQRVEQIRVSENMVSNRAAFAVIEGTVDWFDISDNRFVSNDYSAPQFIRFNGISGETIRGKVEDNEAVVRLPQANAGTIRLTNLQADDEITIDGNRLTPDQNGRLLVESGTGTILTKTVMSNYMPRQATAATWVTATSYAVGNKVSRLGLTFTCLAAHTSGTFSTDLSAGKWQLTNYVEAQQALDQEVYP